MRLFALSRTALAVSCLLMPLGPATLYAGENSDNIEDSASASLATPSDAQSDNSIDSLFAKLLRERDPKQARQLADSIATRWTDSGSATGNLLMQWASEAMAKKKNGLALDLLDQVTVLWPEYAEGWNRRATLHYIMDDYSKSMVDIKRVLALEPRHFGALAGMAAILERSGKDELALQTWEQILTVFPTNRQAQTKVGDLTDKLTGRRT